MKTKKLMILIMSVVMAFGLTMVFTACDDTDSQSTDQAAVEEQEGESADASNTEDAKDVAEAVKEYVALAGEYQDEWSQRASATVIANTEAQNVNITISWSGSATESAEWTMTAVKDGNKLVYSDCTKRLYTYSEDMDEPEDVDADLDDADADTDTDTDADDIDTEDAGADDNDDDIVEGGAKETVVYENGSGSFEISSDGKLLWNGASDEDCTSCVFVKVTE